MQGVIPRHRLSRALGRVNFTPRTSEKKGLVSYLACIPCNQNCFWSSRRRRRRLCRLRRVSSGFRGSVSSRGSYLSQSFRRIRSSRDKELEWITSEYFEAIFSFQCIQFISLLSFSASLQLWAVTVLIEVSLHSSVGFHFRKFQQIKCLIEQNMLWNFSKARHLEPNTSCSLFRTMKCRWVWMFRSGEQPGDLRAKKHIGCFIKCIFRVHFQGVKEAETRFILGRLSEF